MSNNPAIIGAPVQLHPDRLTPNPWNYNTQRDATFSKLAASIRRHGFTRPIIVRTLPGDIKQIIDGEHGWRAAKLLGMPLVPCVDLGDIPDDRAKEMTVVLNELGGSPDEARLSAILREVSGYADAVEALGIMPYSKSELDMLTSTVDFSFSSSSKGDPRPPAQPGDVRSPPKSVIRISYNEELSQELAPLLGSTPEEEALSALRAYVLEVDSDV